MRASAPGQIAIKVSTGPICHNLEDLTFFTELICPSDPFTYEQSEVPVLWRQIKPLDRKLCIGMMRWDKVVMPHPPIIRALEETAQKLRHEGHEGKQLPL
jgi:amidase